MARWTCPSVSRLGRPVHPFQILNSSRVPSYHPQTAADGGHWSVGEKTSNGKTLDYSGLHYFLEGDPSTCCLLHDNVDSCSIVRAYDRYVSSLVYRIPAFGPRNSNLTLSELFPSFL